MNMAAALSMQVFCTGLELLTAAKPGIIIQDDGEPFVHTPWCFPSAAQLGLSTFAGALAVLWNLSGLEPVS